MSRFQKVCEAWVSDTLLAKGTSYKTSVSEDIGSGDDPSKRVFKVVFAKPQKAVPVPPAVAHVKVRVNFESNAYVIKGYQVEGRKQLFGEDRIDACKKSACRHRFVTKAHIARTLRFFYLSLSLFCISPKLRLTNGST